MHIHTTPLTVPVCRHIATHSTDSTNAHNELSLIVYHVCITLVLCVLMCLHTGTVSDVVFRDGMTRFVTGDGFVIITK